MPIFKIPTDEEILSHHGDARNRILDEKEGAEFLNWILPKIGVAIFIIILIVAYNWFFS